MPASMILAGRGRRPQLSNPIAGVVDAIGQPATSTTTSGPTASTNDPYQGDTYGGSGPSTESLGTPECPCRFDTVVKTKYVSEVQTPGSFPVQVEEKGIICDAPVEKTQRVLCDPQLNDCGSRPMFLRDRTRRRQLSEAIDTSGLTTPGVDWRASIGTPTPEQPAPQQNWWVLGGIALGAAAVGAIGYKAFKN